MQSDTSKGKVQNEDGRLTPKELFQKHLKDPNHHVTDEELWNLKVGADAEDETEVEKESEIKKEKMDSIPHNDALPNPYEVLK
jgi:hypothetical protein